MKKILWRRFFGPQSDNRKSKTCAEQRRSIQNLKWLGLSIIAFMLVVAGAVARGAADRKNLPHRFPGYKHCFW